MKLGIMQPYFMPYIGYWQLINAVDRYVVYDDVNYIKGGWINRNSILLNGQPHLINLKLSGASPNKLINEVCVADDNVYFGKLLKTIENAYKKAPYFSDVFPIMESILNYDNKQLGIFLMNQFKTVSDYLGITTEFIMSSDIDKDNSLKKENKVYSICHILGCDEYYNAIGGTQLYSLEEFEKQGLKLSFLRSKPISYQQFKGEFVPNLSLIDVLMFNSKEEVMALLNEYELVQN